MAQQPLVSIVTPSLNQGRFIETTIESVLSQDYPRIEYIVVDGGSTDDTLDVLARYGDRLEWISEPDRGQSHAINKGLGRARGEILAWLNSDDTYLPGAVRSVVDYLADRPECAMVYGDGYLIDEAGRMTRRFPATEPFDLWKLVYGVDYILQQSAFFRRQALEAVGYLDEDLHWAMDWDLFIKIGKRFPVDYVPKALATLRVYDTAKTFSGGTRRLAELVRVMRRHGSRRYPPARLAYAVDTYLPLVFGAAQRAAPPRWRDAIRHVGRAIERRAHTAVDRLLRATQGLDADGWVSSRARFLCRRGAEGRRLLLRGARPAGGRGDGPLGLQARADGVDLGRRDVLDVEFEVAWELPRSVSRPDVVEVELRSRGGVRADRRRRAFRLKTIAIE